MTDDLQITISLREMLALIQNADSVPDMQKSLESLARRVEGLQCLYSQVLIRLKDIMDQIP